MSRAAEESSGGGGGRSLVRSAVMLLRRRPGHLVALVRQYALFGVARLMRHVFPPPNVMLGPNVRLQRNCSLMAELPRAHISVGRDSIVYEDCRLEAFGEGELTIGAGAILGGLRIACRHRVTIGERLLSSWNVFIQDFDAHPRDPELRRLQVATLAASFRPRFDGGAPPGEPFPGFAFPGEEIVLGNDVWLGAGAVILKGARIGSGSIIGAGAVVGRGRWPPRSLLAGNPARVVRSLDDGDRIPHTGAQLPQHRGVSDGQARSQDTSRQDQPGLAREDKAEAGPRLEDDKGQKADEEVVLSPDRREGLLGGQGEAGI